MTGKTPYQAKNFQPGAKWTRLAPVNGDRHFQICQMNIREQIGDLLAVVTGNRYGISVDDLNDPDQWLPGWQRS